MNEAAGAAASTDVSALEERVQQALPEAQIDVASVAPEDLDTALDDAFAGEPDVVVVFGGDGTARAAAKRALATQSPIAPLPGGTMNVLPRLVFGHADLAQAIQDLPTCKITGLDTGFVGGEPPVPTPAEEVESIKAQISASEETEKPKVAFNVGETVKINNGPFLNFSGVIEEIEPERGKLKVTVNIFGRNTPVELEYWQVEKA